MPCEEIERGNRERCENVKQNTPWRIEKRENLKRSKLTDALIGLRSEFKIHGNDSRK